MMSVMSKKEFENWDQYFAVLFDSRSPVELRKVIITFAPDRFIYSVSEIVLNIKNFYIPLNEELKNLISSKYKKLL